VVVAKNPPNEENSFYGFAWMEVGVFFLEDAAAVIVLAKSTGSPSNIELISTYLTITCGVIYSLYFVKMAIFEFSYETLKLPLGGVIFFMYILATEVIFAQDDDPPLSGELEVAAFVVYGITAFFVGGLAMLAFIMGSLASVE